MLEQMLEIFLIDQLCLYTERYIKNIAGLSNINEQPFKDNRKNDCFSYILILFLFYMLDFIACKI